MLLRMVDLAYLRVGSICQLLGQAYILLQQKRSGRGRLKGCHIIPGVWDLPNP